MSVRYGVDTNILLSLIRRDHPRFDVVESAMRLLAGQKVELCFTAQNLGEFWNVCTRPAAHNGFGLSIAETSGQVEEMERTMTLLVEDMRSYEVWRHLLVLQQVKGVQVHDAHLAAVLKTHGVENLLTFNVRDFKRFAGVKAVHPAEIIA